MPRATSDLLAWGALDDFPHLKDYLERLPDGLESYPECKTKNAVLLSSILDHQLSPRIAQLPSPLQTLFREPPRQGFWASAVITDAVFHAICDMHYPSDDEMLAWSRRRALMVKGSIYSAILRVSGPRRFFSFMARTQRIFQRGTVTKNEAIEAGRVLTRLTFPPNLHTRFNLLGNVALLETLATATGARNPRAKMLEWSDTTALFECLWD